MKYLLTNEEMRLADFHTIENLKTPALTLMERAGKALADEAERLLDLRGKRIRLRVLCVCGGGNNGGDGFVCARLLRERGVDTDVVFFAEKTSAQCEINKRKYIEQGGKILQEVPENGYSVAVDCLLGTGFHGALSEPFARAVRGVNALKRSGARILAADIPSGVNGEDGQVCGEGVRADETLCIGERKIGCYLGDGIDHAGKILRADIGISLPNEKYTYLLENEQISAILPQRKRNSHKGSYGKAAIVAGSKDYSGAAYLAMKGCLRAGAGYTALFLPEELLHAFMLKAPEALLVPVNDGGRVAFNEKSFARLLAYDSVAYGSGLGVSEDTATGARWLLENYTGRLILDADALNSLAKYGFDEALKSKKCDLMITPHLKEFSRLIAKCPRPLENKGIEGAKAFAKEYGITVLLKSAVSLITNGLEACLHTRGNAGLAKAGSGDALTGIAAALCANGIDAFNAAKASSYIFGVGAELAARDIGERALLASDAIEYLGKAFLAVAENADEDGDD
ncbi:MAG: NAD(P)H-hydrate dehydratase [Clostridia bacterium]|nr:NAD(P)H-hydrate dehydratase [Clostridia bacterium]